MYKTHVSVVGLGACYLYVHKHEQHPDQFVEICHHPGRFHLANSLLPPGVAAFPGACGLFCGGVERGCSLIAVAAVAWLMQRLFPVGDCHAGNIVPCAQCSRVDAQGWDCGVPGQASIEIW